MGYNVCMRVANDEVRHLLEATLARYGGPAGQIVSVASSELSPGLSGAEIARHELAVRDDEGGARQIRLITKRAFLVERRTLAWLNAQGQPNVPFSHTFDLTIEEPMLVSMQDVGDTYRPSSLDPITREELRREAEGLAAIHAANRGQSEALAWLPRIDRAYIEEGILGRWWRPHWQTALANPRLAHLLEPYVAPVEAAAASLLEECRILIEDSDAFTLLHTDINPSNVLVDDGKPYYIDWQVPHYGPLYLDLPHHFCTREQAEHYRSALAARGKEIPAEDFGERYRVAARCIGFRYLWWTLAAWNGEAEQIAWVRHYLHLICEGEADLPGPA
jgi:Phosphotransferase enzyme family